MCTHPHTQVRRTEKWLTKKWFRTGNVWIPQLDIQILSAFAAQISNWIQTRGQKKQISSFPQPSQTPTMDVLINNEQRIGCWGMTSGHLMCEKIWKRNDEVIKCAVVRTARKLHRQKWKRFGHKHWCVKRIIRGNLLVYHVDSAWNSIGWCRLSTRGLRKTKWTRQSCV